MRVALLAMGFLSVAPPASAQVPTARATDAYRADQDARPPQPPRPVSTPAADGASAFGQPRTRAQPPVGFDPLRPVGVRLRNRVDSRIRNRVNRSYDGRANALSPFEVADDQARGANRSRRR